MVANKKRKEIILELIEDARKFRFCTGLRDRALIGIMIYTFARVGAVLQIRKMGFFNTHVLYHSPFLGGKLKSTLSVLNNDDRAIFAASA